MKGNWREEEFECFVKNKDGYEIPVNGVFKCRYGDSVEAVLVSLKDENGRNVEISEGEKNRIESECAWYKYKNEYGSVGLSKEKKAKVARHLLKIARMLIANGESFVSAFELDRFDDFQWDDATRTVMFPYIVLDVDRDIVYEYLQDWQGNVSSNKFNLAILEHLQEILEHALFDDAYGFDTKCMVERIEDNFESSGKVYLYNVKFIDMTDFELERMNDFLGE